MKVIERQYLRVRDKIKTQLLRVYKKLKSESNSRELSNQDIELSLYQMALYEPVSEVMQEKVDRLLCKLDKEQMHLVSLYYFEGKTLKQISEEIGTCEATVSNKIQEALRVMRG